MKVTKRDTGEQILAYFDKKQLTNYLKKVKQITKECEYKSKTSNFSVILSSQRQPYIPVKGWASRLIEKNGRIREVFFADYDGILKKYMMEELRWLYKKLNCPILIFKSKELEDVNKETYGNYLIICLRLFNFNDAIDWHNYLHVHKAHTTTSKIYRFKTYVLRIGFKGKKPPVSYLDSIGDLNKKYDCDISEPHLNILKQLYPKIPNYKYKNKVKGEAFKSEYITASK